MSYHLRQRGREHVILERNRIGERWRSERWDSLRFQLPNQWLSLPGKPYAGSNPDGFSHHSEVVRMIVEYADEIHAPVRTGVAVRCLQASNSGGYMLDTTAGQIVVRHVILATGPFQKSRRGKFSQDIPASIEQIDATSYRSPSQLPDGAVLVIGSGNSGCQIADELLRSGRRVFLSMGRHLRVPRRYRGKDVIWWYDALGRFDVNITSLPSGKYPPTTIMTGVDGGYDLSPRSLGAGGVRLLGRVMGCDNATLHLASDAEDTLLAAEKGYLSFLRDADALADAHPELGDFELRTDAREHGPLAFDAPRSIDLMAENIRSIVWAGGHDFSLDWVKLPVLDAAGAPVQKRGVTACRGVYFVGLHWMHTFRSAILPFVEKDAAYIADHIDQHTH